MSASGNVTKSEPADGKSCDLVISYLNMAVSLDFTCCTMVQASEVTQGLD